MNGIATIADARAAVINSFDMRLVRNKGQSMPLLFVILDGAADRKNSILNGMTPFQSAKTPNLRELASWSVKDMMYPIGKGIAPESDAAVFSILGYDMSSYTGRGPLEAYGAGLKITNKSVAFRCNFATIDANMNIIDRRAGRIETKDAKALQKEIAGIDLGMEGIRFKFKATVGHRGVCVFYSSKKDLSANVSNADIGYVRKGNISVAEETTSKVLPRMVPLDDSDFAANTARIVNTFIGKVIDRLSHSEVNSSRERKGLLKANVLLLRDAGVGLPKVETFEARHKMKCAFIAEMPVEMGIAKLLGMAPIKLKVLKNKRRRYRKMAELVNQNVSNYDFIYVHIKGPDEPGHDGDAKLKKEVLEEVDESFFSEVKGLDADICVTCDHATPCTLKAHSSDPVPVMVRYADSRSGDQINFDEEIDSKGGMGVINGNKLVDYIIKGRSNVK